MKTNKLIGAMAAGVLLMLVGNGCSNEQEVTIDKGEGKLITITATHGDAATRLAFADKGLGNKIEVNWKSGDAFMLYRGGGTGQTFTTSADGSREGSVSIAPFTGIAPEGTGNYFAFYPASKGEKTFADCFPSVLEQVQLGVDSPDHLSEYNYMYAGITDLSAPIVFTPLTATLRFRVNLPSGKYPKQLTLTTQEKSEILISQKMGNSGVCAKQLTMSIAKERDADGKLVDADFSEFTAYMSLFESTLTSGNKLMVSITCTDGTIYNYGVDLAADKNYGAGKVFDANLTVSGKLNEIVPDAVFDSSTNDVAMPSEGDTYKITTAAHLKDFVTRVNDGETFAAKTVKLLTDIQIDAAATWTPIGTDDSTPFKGTFDGGGHTISGQMNLNVKHAGFFGYIDGASIENLHISAKVRVSGSSVQYVGAVAGSANSGYKISHCTLSGTFSFPESWSSSYTQISIGGIVGISNTGSFNGSIYSCSSIADLAVDLRTDALSYVYIGGIVGYVRIAISTGSGMYHCSNSGNITIAALNSNHIYAGGIAGFAEGFIGVDDFPYDVKYCRNKGSVAITNGPQTSAYQYAGGILGQASYVKMHTSHHEKGSISLSITTKGYKGALVGNPSSGSPSKIYDCCTGYRPVDGSLYLIGPDRKNGLDVDVSHN